MRTGIPKSFLMFPLIPGSLVWYGSCIISPLSLLDDHGWADQPPFWKKSSYSCFLVFMVFADPNSICGEKRSKWGQVLSIDFWLFSNPARWKISPNLPTGLALAKKSWRRPTFDLFLTEKLSAFKHLGFFWFPCIEFISSAKITWYWPKMVYFAHCSLMFCIRKGLPGQYYFIF